MLPILASPSPHALRTQSRTLRVISNVTSLSLHGCVSYSSNLTSLSKLTSLRLWTITTGWAYTGRFNETVALPESLVSLDSNVLPVCTPRLTSLRELTARHAADRLHTTKPSVSHYSLSIGIDVFFSIRQRPV